ncbi:MAG TPA: C-GCAxxG-C-C family protein [Sedimentisphaerales bacterium]|nr:C-GCAxxG-C-C family protein [Sedimentisphaerales bacterium]
MSRSEKALGIFSEGANCAQAVLASFTDETHIDRADSMKIAASFGGGIKQALACGAVTGALMVLGMRYGCTDHTNMKEKARITAITRDFQARFVAKHGSLSCKDLLGVNISTKQGHDEAAARGLFKSECTRFVASAVEILEEMAGQTM